MNHRPESSYIENVWAQAFQTIQRINYITTHLENNTETYSKPYYHILRVLRAMLYLDMIQHWGDLPFFTKHSSIEDMESLSQLPESPKYEIASLWSKFIGSDYGYFNTLIRLGIAVELLDIKPYELLYPIPIRELHVNQYMTQNPGY